MGCARSEKNMLKNGCSVKGKCTVEGGQYLRALNTLENRSLNFVKKILLRVS